MDENRLELGLVQGELVQREKKPKTVVLLGLSDLETLGKHNIIQ